MGYMDEYPVIGVRVSVKTVRGKKLERPRHLQIRRWTNLHALARHAQGVVGLHPSADAIGFLAHRTEHNQLLSRTERTRQGRTGSKQHQAVIDYQ